MGRAVSGGAEFRVGGVGPGGRGYRSRRRVLSAADEPHAHSECVCVRASPPPRVVARYSPTYHGAYTALTTPARPPRLLAAKRSSEDGTVGVEGAVGWSLCLGTRRRCSVARRSVRRPCGVVVRP